MIRRELHDLELESLSVDYNWSALWGEDKKECEREREIRVAQQKPVDSFIARAE